MRDDFSSAVTNRSILSGEVLKHLGSIADFGQAVKDLLKLDVISMSYSKDVLRVHIFEKLNVALPDGVFVESGSPDYPFEYQVKVGNVLLFQLFKMKPRRDKIYIYVQGGIVQSVMTSLPVGRHSCQVIVIDAEDAENDPEEYKDAMAEREKDMDGLVRLW